MFVLFSLLFMKEEEDHQRSSALAKMEQKTNRRPFAAGG